MSREYEDGRLHLYEDLMDPGCMFLEIEGPEAVYDCGPRRLEVRIPKDIWDKIRQHAIIHQADAARAAWSSDQ